MLILPELKSRVEDSEELVEEINTYLDAAETRVEAVEKKNQGKINVYILITILMGGQF